MNNPFLPLFEHVFSGLDVLFRTHVALDELSIPSGINSSNVFQ